MSCQNVQCDFLYSSYTDNPCKQANRSREGNHMKLMYKQSLVFVKLVRGIKGIENALRCKNIHLMNNNSYNAYHKAAAESMHNAVADVKSKHPVTDPMIIPYPTCRVSLDGSWQKRGHASLHSVVTAISEGKCVDAQVLTKNC